MAPLGHNELSELLVLCRWPIVLRWLIVIPPASTKLIGGYTGTTLSVRPSVCPSVDRIVSALYLQQYSSDPFYICTSYQATSEGVSRVMPVSKFKNLKFWWIFKICNFDFVIFWHWDPIWLNGMGNPQNAGVLVFLVSRALQWILASVI